MPDGMCPILIVFLFLLVFGIVFLYKNKEIKTLLLGKNFVSSQSSEIKKVCFVDYCFLVELADEPQEQVQGLMFRESMDQDRGMLFIFQQKSIYSFWMKNTLIPLDIIWIDENKEVVFIENNVQPCKEDPCFSINPGREAKYALEINGGIAEKIGLALGNKLIFSK